MGVLVFALAIMNNSKNGHHEVMRAEVPGPVFGKVVAKLKNTAQILYIIYLTMFVIFAVILWLCGMQSLIVSSLLWGAQVLGDLLSIMTLSPTTTAI